MPSGQSLSDMIDEELLAVAAAETEQASEVFNRYLTDHVSTITTATDWSRFSVEEVSHGTNNEDG